MKIIKTTCYKGTVIRVGNEKRNYINHATEILMKQKYDEIEIPIIQHEETFQDKVGEENNNLMFKFRDRKEREICLAPEYTSVIQKLAKEDYKHQRNIKMFYILPCARGERQQVGRWRQFTQLGVEILNPTNAEESLQKLIDLAVDLTELVIKSDKFTVIQNTKRGLDYYKDGEGFEIRHEAGLQLCGGGIYDGGVGFAIGVDRLFVEYKTSAEPYKYPATSPNFMGIHY